MQPRYTMREATCATRIPASTLRSWLVGQTYQRKADVGFFEPVIRRPQAENSRLSFTNLIEAHVLRALRTVHEVKMGAIREAVGIAEAELGIERLLVNPGLRTSAGELFLDHYSALLHLSPSRQLAMRAVLAQYLQRVEYDEMELPTEFYPFARNPGNLEEKVVLLSSFVSFGRPVLRRTGVSTRAVVQRLDAGEDQSVILQDYEITKAELEEAVLYEVAA